MGCKKPSCAPGCDCDRYLEIWNLVFTQYNRQTDGSLVPLPKRNIDTGMGLERLCAVLQNKTSGFETDLIRPVIDQIEARAERKEKAQRHKGTKAQREQGVWSLESGVRSQKKSDKADQWIIADHIRAICHLIYDGIMPSNEERGYVLRRLIRRAVLCERKLGISDNFLYQLVVGVANIFPYLKEKRDYISQIISLEEERFGKTIEHGFSLLDEKLSKGAISGADLFELYDTYGLPIEFAREEAEERGLDVDLEGFNLLMSEQRERARDRRQKTEDRRQITEEKTEFVGYKETEIEAMVVKVMDDGIILDKTPFYPESGGQIGDTGWLIRDGEKIKVEDTQKLGGAILHKTGIEFKEGDKVMALIDGTRRRAIARAHTATHLLHYALRQVLGEHIRQAGSLVAEDRLRFDFTHLKKLDEREIERCEEIIVQRIMENAEIEILENMPLEEAKKMGAMALFEDE
ncbi:MAG: alanine--tRNA ligase, partial [Candidatus Desantisbacteria bacterium]